MERKRRSIKISFKGTRPNLASQVMKSSDLASSTIRKQTEGESLFLKKRSLIPLKFALSSNSLESAFTKINASTLIIHLNLNIILLFLRQRCAMSKSMTRVNTAALLKIMMTNESMHIDMRNSYQRKE